MENYDTANGEALNDIATADEGFINASKAGGTEPVLNPVENDNTTLEE